MSPAPFPNCNFMQACWVVPDLEAAVDSWVHTAGIGPFFWMDSTTFTEGSYRGEPAGFPEITAALTYAGDLQIELVQQNQDAADTPSIFRDMFPSDRFGLHHMALYCTNYEAERDAYVAAGAEIAFEGWIAGSRTCWVDTASTLGFMVELLEPSPMREKSFAVMRDSARRWDGSNPIVRLGDRANGAPAGDEVPR